MSSPEQKQALQELGEACLRAFESALVGNYKLTLVARNVDHPDGSHDVLVTDDDTERGVAALRVLAAREAMAG